MSEQARQQAAPGSPTVGDLVVAFLECLGVRTVFGIISIHNLPIADALARRDAIRFVPVRNEAGAVNMADAGARSTGRIGVLLTSTGAGCANACAGLLECLGAGTPLLHITGNVETRYLDRVTGYTHETPTQFRMLEGVSKAAFRVHTPETALGTLREAARVALSAPRGPVTVEIPIDVQKMPVCLPADFGLVPPSPIEPCDAAVERIAAMLRRARRPMLWLGGGAAEAGDASLALLRAGMGAASSVQGRGIVPDDHPQNLGSMASLGAAPDFLGSCDFMLVAGSRLRSAQTHSFRLPLPHPLVIVDADPRAENRNYPCDAFVCADAQRFLSALAGKLGKLDLDPAFHDDLRAARRSAESTLRAMLGPYEALLDALIEHAPADFNWVRDITISNSTWGNRLPPLRAPRRGVYSVSGAIGMGLAQGIGAAIAAPQRKTIALVGDGGLSLSLGEVATAVQERANLTIILMNDGGYGIMRNLQDAHFGGRRFAADLLMPDFGLFARSLGLPHRRVAHPQGFSDALREMLAIDGPSLLEADMAAIGPFAQAFGGPPTPYNQKSA
ncbi:Acetolactate synthase isozyme 2 large subunit [Pigmentiphaga humi]|uniref:Acetolactate synthase isozyme 2 large subunit n=1 Tax=Pigmentiphaga humi TaxID=2478468 RepID=A0A3P4B4H0_9BURK|nr:thiamine pyrophosphate-binding protein [Pigmentiphaga humi]VCU70952.1 Acetolactate synthase isozyme 2 large subunit [Pigmentiphaga humi]